MDQYMPDRRTDDRPPRGSAGIQITDVARQEFARLGFNGVSIRDIAMKAHVSLSALYHYFPSKLDLLFEILRESTADYQQHCQAALRTAPVDPRSQLEAFVEATVLYRVRRSVESNLVQSEMRTLNPEQVAELNVVRKQASSLLADIITQGTTQGVFTTTIPDEARRAIFAICNAITRWYDPSGSMNTDELVRRYVELSYALVGYQEIGRGERSSR